MSWTRYLFGDFWTTREFDRIDADLRRRGWADRKARVALRELVKELEDDLGRVALLARSLVDACLAKGIVTRDELATLIAKADLGDGEADGKLDPKRIR